MSLNLSPLIYDVPGVYYIFIKLLDDIDWDWLQWLGAEQGEPDTASGCIQTQVSNLVLDWCHPAFLAVVQALGHVLNAVVEGHRRVSLTVQRDDEACHLLVHFLWSLNRESREHVKELGGETQCLTCSLPKKYPNNQNTELQFDS